MFSFLPLLLIILSLAGIVVMVFRRTPELRTQGLVDKISWSAAREGTAKLWSGLKWLARRFWQFVMEMKGLSRSANFRKLPQAFSRIHFPSIPKPKVIPFFGHSDTPEFFHRQAEEAYEREDYMEAERQYIKAIECDPKSEASYAGLGRIYLQQRKFEDAAQTYKFLTKHHPENDSYHSSLGQAYHGQKLYDKAVMAYERAIELSPGNPKRYVNLGLTLEAQRHVEEAILNYRRAVEMEKDNTQFLMVLADALVKKDAREQAELILEQIIALEPTNHQAREKLMQLKF